MYLVKEKITKENNNRNKITRKTKKNRLHNPSPPRLATSHPWKRKMNNNSHTEKGTRGKIILHCRSDKKVLQLLSKWQKYYKLESSMGVKCCVI